MTPLGSLVLLLPPGSDAVSGGNVYNAELWRHLGGLAPSRAVPRTAFEEAILAGEPGVFFVDSLDLAAIGTLPPRRPGQRVVLIVHHLPSLEPEPDERAVLVEDESLKGYDGYLCTSPFTRDLLLARGFSAARLLLVEPGLPAVELSDGPRTPPIRALVVANLVRRKGVLELLEALVTRVRARDRFVLDVWGRSDLEPAYASACESAARAVALGLCVHLHGAASYRGMGSVYQRADLMVSAAAMETFGMALHEARAHGVPILTLDGGHAKSHVTPGENGLVVASIDELGDELVRLVRDAPALEALTRGARRLASPGGDRWGETAERLVAELGRLA